MEFDKERFITVTLRWLDTGNTVVRDVYKFDDRGIYYTREYSLAIWCSYSDNVVIDYEDETYELKYSAVKDFLPKAIEEKYSDTAGNDYIDLDDIIM